MRRVRLIAILLLLSALPMFAQTNPFFARPGDAAGLEAPAGEQAAPPEMDHGPMGLLRFGDGFIGRIWADSTRTLSVWQRDLNRRLGVFLRGVSDGGLGLGGWFAVLAFSFLFGLLHAVLPGHRKSVLISYCIADRARVVHGVGLGFLFALMHALSAVVIVFVTVSLVEVSLGSTVAHISRVTQIISSILLIGIGFAFCYLTGRELLQLRGGHPDLRHGGGHCSGSGEPTVPDTGGTNPRTAKWIPVVLSTGIIPCPITTAILLFAVSVNAVGIGLAAIVSLSAGLGVALAALAILTIFVKGKVLALLDKRAGHLLHAGVELVGGLMILAVGGITLMLLL